MKIHNFLFHRVSPCRDVLWDPVDVKLFDKCISYIKKNFTIITVEDVLNPLENKKYATISFDDGYKDNIEYALPILEKYKVKASFYIVTDCIDYNIPTWTYCLDFLFLNTQQKVLKLDFSFIDSSLKNALFESAEQRISFAKKIKPALKKLQSKQRTQIINVIKDTFYDVQVPEMMMNWDDIKHLKSLGHHIGSHTVSHNMLGTMSNLNEVTYELEKSRSKIFEMLGHYPYTISYPIGSYNQNTIDISKNLGYKIGLAVKQDVYYVNKNNVFEIPRIELYNESWFKTKLRINHTLEMIKKIIKYK